VYVTDNAKIHALSGWAPQIKPAQVLSDIFEWIRANETSVKNLLS
jgi:hypothetical protein